MAGLQDIVDGGMLPNLVTNQVLNMLLRQKRYQSVQMKVKGGGRIGRYEDAVYFECLGRRFKVEVKEV